jgi:hypothetical protein
MRPKTRAVAGGSNGGLKREKKEILLITCLENNDNPNKCRRK